MQLHALLAAHGIGSYHELQWVISHTRALALYAAIMTREGYIMEWAAERSHRDSTMQRKLRASLTAYLGSR